jgi:hypothetical protein
MSANESTGSVKDQQVHWAPNTGWRNRAPRECTRDMQKRDGMRTGQSRTELVDLEDNSISTGSLESTLVSFLTRSWNLDLLRSVNILLVVWHTRYHYGGSLPLSPMIAGSPVLCIAGLVSVFMIAAHSVLPPVVQDCLQSQRVSWQKSEGLAAAKNLDNCFDGCPAFLPIATYRLLQSQ